MKLDEQHAYVALALSFVLAAVMLLAGSQSYTAATALAFGSLIGVFIGAGAYKAKESGWQDQIGRRHIMFALAAGVLTASAFLTFSSQNDVGLVSWLLSGLANAAGISAGYLFFWAVYWKAGSGPKW